MTAELELNFGTPIPKAEAASYPAICVGLEPFQINEGTADVKTLIRWDFSLDGVEDPEQPGMNVILDGVTSTATGKKSKMRPWVTALIGRNLEEALPLSGLRALVKGKACLVRVEINDAGYSKVADVLPPIRTAARTPIAPIAPNATPEPVGAFSGAPTTPAMAPDPDLPF